MLPLQITSDDGRLELKVGPRRANLLLEGERVAGFDVHHEDALSAARAEELADLDPERWLVTFRRSSPDARAILQRLGLSYASEVGELYVHRPPLRVELQPRRRLFGGTRERSSAFALRASRIPRWLLLHAGTRPTFSQLSADLDLSASIVSRTLHTLADEGFVEISFDPADSRVRRAALRRPAQMLEAFERAIAGRRMIQRSWDIGARDPEEAMQRLRRAAVRLPLPYAIGGLAGASLLAPTVDPASVDVWVQRADLEPWTQELDAYPTRPASGTVTFRSLPDPFVFSFAWQRRNLTIADPVQLFLDCRAAGERAIDAAEAIRKERGW